MTQESQNNTRPATQTASANGVPAWDSAAATSSYCTIANATSGEGAVLLHFGVPEARDDARGELGVRALHRVALSPTTAQQLQQLLERVLAEYGAR